jgi:hypothetical protein
MDKKLRYMAMAGLLVILIGVFFLANHLMKPDPAGSVAGVAGASGSGAASGVKMAVSGDPRMLICDGPSDSPFATPQALAALGLEGPLERAENEAAAYRFTVIRLPGQPAQSVRFATGTTAKNTAIVINWSGAAGAEPAVDSFEVAHGPAMSIFGMFSSSPIWGEPKPLMATRLVRGDAGVVIEVKSEKFSRCITTRFDDERIYPIAAALKQGLIGYLKETSLDDIVAPERAYDARSGGGK